MVKPAAQHAELTRLLTKYGQEGADGVNRVDYGAWKANAADSAALDAYIASFADMDIDALSDNEQFAAWANAYNALTVQHILGRYPLKSIRSGYIVGPWKRVKMNVGGQKISLHSIENDVLREEWSDDPRLHYAINCASYSCPNLLPKAWEAATLDNDLEAAARAFINDPRGVSIRKNGTLSVSNIFEWYDEDYGGSEETIIAHILKYAEPELAAQINANPNITDYDYDWSLNDVE